MNPNHHSKMETLIASYFDSGLTSPINKQKRPPHRQFVSIKNFNPVESASSSTKNVGKPLMRPSDDFTFLKMMRFRQVLATNFQ
jgi:hypothetical protein